MEKSLGRIAEDAFESSVRKAGDPDLWEETAAAVEKAVLARLKKDEEEPMPVAGQELTNHQVLDWIKKHGSTKGLQWRNEYGEWCHDNVTPIYAFIDYRVAPKKINAPDDPTTWEKGVAIFRRDFEDEPWVLDVFGGYCKGSNYKYHSERGAYKYAKLATPEQAEAWKLIMQNSQHLSKLKRGN